MWLKPYLSSITCRYMSLLAEESKQNFRKKKLSKSLLYHILSGIYDSYS